MYLHYWKLIEITGNGLKLLEFDIGVWELQLGSGVKKFPGLVYKLQCTVQYTMLLAGKS